MPSIQIHQSGYLSDVIISLESFCYFIIIIDRQIEKMCNVPLSIVFAYSCKK